MSRIGNAIESIAASDRFYGLTLGDNSVRVIRTDNNKSVVSHQNTSFNMAEEQRCKNLSSSANLLVVPNGDRL